MEDRPPEKQKRPRRISRLLRRAAKASAGLVVAGVLGFTLYAVVSNVRGGGAVERVESALDDRGLLDRYPAYVRAGERDSRRGGGSAEYWLAAMEAQPDAGELALPVVGYVMVDVPEAREQYAPDMVAAMREAVDGHPLFWGLIAAARGADPTPFGLGRGWLDPMADAEVLGGARGVARWIQMRALLAEAEGDGEAFTDSILGMLDLNNAMQDEPGLTAELIRTSIDAMTYHALAEGLSRIELTPGQVDRLIAAFAHRQASHPIERVLGHAISEQYHLVTRDVAGYIRGAEARQQRFTQRFWLAEPDWADGAERPEPPSALGVLWSDLLLATCPGRYELRHAETMDLAIANYDRLVALDKKPAERWAWLAQQEQEFDDEDHDAGEYRHMRTLFSIGVAKSMLSARSNLAVTVAALQVERYRVEHGRWPATLEDATVQTPIDARGEAIRYRVAPEGVVVYNTGRNTADEQGYHDRDFPDPGYPDADDHAFRLYDPHTRNTLPPPPFEPEPYDAAE